MYKQVIVVRRDLPLSKGKLAVQVAHASLDSYKRSPAKVREEWFSEGEKKVVLQVEGVKEMTEIHQKAKSYKIPCALIKDAGRTELPPGTVTALGIGPSTESEIDRLTGSLKML